MVFDVLWVLFVGFEVVFRWFVLGFDLLLGVGCLIEGLFAFGSCLFVVLGFSGVG